MDVGPLYAREYFAGQALPALISQGNFDGSEAQAKTIAHMAFFLAEAMVARRAEIKEARETPANQRARRLRRMAPDLLTAVRMCLKAERDRAAKLKPGSPASTYTATRIRRLEALIEKAEQ